MDIGPEKETIVIEPVEEPVPGQTPAPAPEETPIVLPEPDKVPVSSYAYEWKVINELRHPQVRITNLSG